MLFNEILNLHLKQKTLLSGEKTVHFDRICQATARSETYDIRVLNPFAVEIGRPVPALPTTGQLSYLAEHPRVNPATRDKRLGR